MKRYSLEEIRKTQKGRGFYLKIFNEAASRLVYLLQDRKLSANAITAVSFLFGIGFFLTVSFGHYLAGIVMLSLLYLFDNMDGQWARVKGESSTFGALFDSLVDGWNITLMAFALGIAAYHRSGETEALYLTALFFALSFLDFALEKNLCQERQKGSGEERGEEISLQKRSSTLRPIIALIDRMTLYDKWILVTTIALLAGEPEWALLYFVAVRFVNYSVKLFKFYLAFR
ncbi:CDP-alcohol phosphatidyltransferase family protein [Hydrogenimonas sp. SS33]|uniref:CDP-alcohol phosphatidyltransferase family protein n=1 Tax=Hydrogenimonas leucolamina TaxID=2954236 RepID=UPI00336C2163